VSQQEAAPHSAKEFGSLVNQATDIHTASRQLRHATIKMTAAVYTTTAAPWAAVPIGAMLKPQRAAKGGGSELALMHGSDWHGEDVAGCGCQRS